GSSQEVNLPRYWGPGSNIVWQSELPGSGHASPIVWGERVFIAAAAPENEERLLLCLSLQTGEILWRTAVLSAPMEHKHSLNSFASSTPATDGELVFTAFLDKDKMFVAAYDFRGKQRWAARPGDFASMHGFCTSPILHRDKVLLNGDHDGESYLAALSRS